GEKRFGCPRPALEWLYSLAHYEAVDQFPEPEGAEKKLKKELRAGALKAMAAAAAERRLTVSTSLSEAEVKNVALAKTEKNGLRWYYFQSCSCSGFTHGCASASYLFDSNGKRVSALVLPRTHKANIREELSSASVELLDGGVGRLWAQSVWGGGDEQHVVY